MVGLQLLDLVLEQRQYILVLVLSSLGPLSQLELLGEVVDTLESPEAVDEAGDSCVHLVLRHLLLSQQPIELLGNVLDDGSGVDGGFPVDEFGDGLHAEGELVVNGQHLLFEQFFGIPAPILAVLGDDFTELVVEASVDLVLLECLGGVDQGGPQLLDLLLEGGDSLVELCYFEL